MTRDVGPAGPQGEANTYLAFAAFRLDQKQIRHVRTGHQQEDEYGGQDRPEDRGYVTDDRVLEWIELPAEASEQGTD